MRKARLLPFALSLLVIGEAATAAEAQRLALESGWRLESSARVAQKGEALSKPGFADGGWQAVTVPNTVVGALVENGTFRDPYFGMNLRSIPGTTYPVGERFMLLPTPEDSPYKVSWWYRKQFELPAALAGRRLFLHFDGVNYRANVWLNGTRIAGSDTVVGAFRRFEFDVTSLAHTGAANALAVEVFAPEPHDLSIMWVDWNPTPADKNLGLWGDVYVTNSGPLALRFPQVVSKLDLPALDKAHLTVTTEVWNPTDKAVSGLVRGSIEAIQFSEKVSLGAGERKTVRFTPAQAPQLDVVKPRLWWPYRMGTPNLYTLKLEAEVNGAVSDRQEVHFGIQEMSSELTSKGHRLFKVNGKPVLVRGGGWASDMMLRPKTRERLETEMRYVKEMGLNTIRLEGKLESDLFYDLADREGILTMPGWCCCDQWEQWAKWDAEDHRVAPASLTDQLLRLRHHPSVLAWFNGSDNAPTAEVERKYLDIEAQLEWPKPTVSSATEQQGPVSGPSGVKMRGPYDYVPPSYWLSDTQKGGAFGFATEIGPGGAVPPIESLKQMLPPEHLWPIDEFWNFHAGGDEFRDIHLFTDALEGRYGKVGSAEDYARKAQALAYEGQRAMFEGYSANRYTSTGVIQWMLNNAWPSLIWHLYDYYLRPGGGYYGTKKACEPVHVQYAYNDGSVVVVNDTLEAAKGLKVSAEVFDLKLASRFSQEVPLDAPADSVTRALTVPKLPDLSSTYFLRLKASGAAGQPVSSNFYWLSTREDVLDEPQAKWYYTPVKSHADLTALAQLPATRLKLSARVEAAGPEGRARVKLENAGGALAFQVHLKLTAGSEHREILPVYWQDNYIAVFPGESREIVVSYPAGQKGPLAVEAEAWNAPAVSSPAVSN